jgi:hypothetical protein
VAVTEGSFQTLALNRSWSRSLDAGKDCWLEMEACDEGSVESERADGVDEGGGGRAFVGDEIVEAALDRKSGIPQLVLMPAPVMTPTRCDSTRRSAISCGARLSLGRIFCRGILA